MQKSRFSIIGVPIDCIGCGQPSDSPHGTELSPRVLREAGLAKAMRMQDFGDLSVRITGAVRDRPSGILASESVCEITRYIRSTVKDCFQSLVQPFLVGGCCTELIGALAGARDWLGSVGLVYVDGHIDLYDGGTSPTGEAADMPLATVLGRGPQELLQCIGPQQVLMPEHLVMLGYRDLDDAKSRGSLLPADIGLPTHADFDAAYLHKADCGYVGEHVSNTFAALQQKYWLHLDFDVLDQSIFPATDYLMPGGLNWEQLENLLQPIASDNLIGVSIACYNPEKDPEQKCARDIVTHLSRIFT
jgi:arginase